MAQGAVHEENSKFANTLNTSLQSIFNVMLREFGVRDVKVQEIFGLDEELLAMLP